MINRLVAVTVSALKRYYYDIQQFVTEDFEKKCEELARDSQQTPETCSAAVLVDDLLNKQQRKNTAGDYKLFLNVFCY